MGFPRCWPKRCLTFAPTRGRGKRLTNVRCFSPVAVGRAVRRHFSCARPQSRYFQVSAPSKRRIRTDPSALGSKFLAFTASRLFGFGCSGSQCVTHPQLRHRIVLSVLSSQTYSVVFSG